MKDWDDIKINKRSTDKVFFESPLIQSISDKIDFLRDESKEILKELDSTELKQQIDQFDIEKFGEDTINQIDDLIDELSQFKDKILDSEDIPDIVKESSNEFKANLNRDEIYVKKARKKLARLNNDDKLLDKYDASFRIIELCDKAIDLNYRNADAYYLKGIALINLGKYHEAVKQLIKSLALDGDNIDARLNVGNAYRLNREFDNAIDAYDSVLKRDENSFEAFKGKAVTYYYWEKYGKADECFKKANSIETLDEKSKEIWDICLNEL